LIADIQVVVRLARKKVKRVSVRLLSIASLSYLLVIYVNSALMGLGVIEDGKTVQTGIYATIGVIFLATLFIAENISCQKTH
jgi:hypothetical protein